MASNFYIDPSQVDQIQDERVRNQAREMLKQFPHLAGNTVPPKQAEMRNAPVDNDVLDYSNFGPQNMAAPPSMNRPKPPTLQIDPVNHMFSDTTVDSKKEEEEKEPERPVGMFDPTGKEHPILVKMRAVVGLSNKKYTKDVPVGGVKYTLEPLDNSATTRAVVLAAMNSLNDAEYRLNIDTASVAYSVSHIDKVPIETVFSVPTVKDTDKNGVEIKFTIVERKELAAQMFYGFLKSSPPSVAETLEQHFKQEFPPVDMLEAGQSFGHCPAPNCAYVRIMSENEVAYCPHHGERLIKEGDLPNPS